MTDAELKAAQDADRREQMRKKGYTVLPDEIIWDEATGIGAIAFDPYVPPEEPVV
jgi:hypothetical protein